MPQIKSIFTVFAMTSALLLTSCGGSSDKDKTVDPFSEGDLLEAMQGDWFDTTCNQDLSGNRSSLEQMEFKFRKPFSWEDSFFEDDSLEFTGSLTIQDVEYDNAYCLGSGLRKNDLIASNVSINNISVIKSSVKANSFKAFYVQEKERDFDKKLDTGLGVLLEFKRINGAFVITPLNSFTYQGKNFDLQALADTNDVTNFSYSNAENPIEKQNIDDVAQPTLKTFLQSSGGNCTKYYIIDRTYSNSNGDYNGLFIVMQSHKDGLKFSYSNRTNNMSNIFQTTNLDWIYERGQVHAEKGFQFFDGGDNFIQVINKDLNLNQAVIPSFKSKAQLNELMETKGLTADIFENCK
jgi:hypothetical protein